MNCEQCWDGPVETARCKACELRVCSQCASTMRCGVARLDLTHGQASALVETPNGLDYRMGQHADLAGS